MVLGPLFVATLGSTYAEPVFRATVTLEFGPDRGQNFGTLFEVCNASGQTILGAGFPAVYNTYARNDRIQMQFFARALPGAAPVVEPLPKPSAICGQYIYDLDGRIYARGDKTPCYWDAEARQWCEAADDPMTVMRVGRGRLVFRDSQATYEGKIIIARPGEGVYSRFYYAQGHFFMYHTRSGDGGFTRVWAVPWQPGAPPVDLARARAVECRYVGEAPFVWAQRGEEALTVSNNGGVYVFNGRTWRVLRQADKSVSFQIYSSLNYYDRLLLAQYPTGNLFAYDGRELQQLSGWPPVMPGASSRAREAQSMMLYGGDLYVGVWPWAELWRYDRHTDRWAFLQRMFTQPPLTDKFDHPYEEDIRAYNAARHSTRVINDWGQRLTSMAPWRDSLMLATSAKGTYQHDPAYAFLTDDLCAQYGRVYRFHVPGVLSVPVAWKDQPTQLCCTLEMHHLRIEQDGKLLAEASVPAELVKQLKPASITWGRGLFGPCTCTQVPGTRQAVGIPSH
jgi:hypothetical protein